MWSVKSNASEEGVTVVSLHRLKRISSGTVESFMSTFELKKLSAFCQIDILPVVGFLDWDDAAICKP